MRRPEDVVNWARQRYSNQRRRWLDGAGEWPLTVSLERPSEQAALRDPVAVRAWSEAWATWTPMTTDVALETEAVAWQRIGTQTLPCRISFATPASVARLIGEGSSWQRATVRRVQLVHRWPQLAEAGLGTHFDVLASWHDSDFERLGALLEWFETNPRSGLYLRQLPVRGIDTKWIDLHRRGVVSDLLRRLRGNGIASSDEPDQATGPDFFELCGLRRPTARIRVLLLSPELRRAAGGLRDIEAPLEQLQALDLTPRRALLVENLETAYALPDFAGTVAFVKLGNAVSLASQMPWMTDAQVVYWGDIDTHGFGILAQARKTLSNVTSVLMDEATLLDHHDRCVPEPTQTRNADVSMLTDAEAGVYRGLLDGTWGQSLRLEQERIEWLYGVSRISQALT
ncbi:MAG: hypothetical protein KJ011_01280 [Burkholderiaceae bacterium]|nr:hypothetical protein [Burkholderiaceae bacterium]